MADMHDIVIKSVKNFIAQKIEPLAAVIDENEDFPMDNFKELGKLGYLSIPFSDEYGEDAFQIFISVVEEIAKVCASTAMTLVSHSILSCSPIYKFGLPETKQKYLAQMLTGTSIGAFALTEANNGSDIATMQTRAEEDGDYYIINGSKIYITNANIADVLIVAVKTANNKGILGISLFVVEKAMEGVTVSQKKERKLGMRGELPPVK